MSTSTCPHYDHEQGQGDIMDMASQCHREPSYVYSFANGDAGSPGSRRNRCCWMKSFQTQDMHVTTDTDANPHTDDDDDDDDYPALMAIKEQVQRMDQWLNDVMQPLLLAEKQQQQQVQGGVIRWYNDDDDDDDSDQDGIEEECFALHYYSERKLRHELQMVDLILIPALSLSRPWINNKDIPETLHDWEGTWSESFQLPLQPQHHSLQSPSPVPATPSPKEKLRNDHVEYGPILPRRPIKIGTEMSNLSFDSTLTSPKVSSSSSPSSKRSARSPASPTCPPFTQEQQISSIQQSYFPQEDGTLLLSVERKTVDQVLGHPAQDATSSQGHLQSHLPRLSPVSISSNNVVIPNQQHEQGGGLDQIMTRKILEDLDGMGNAIITKPLPVDQTLSKASRGKNVAPGTRPRQQLFLTIDTDCCNLSKHGRTTPSHDSISPPLYASEQQDSSTNSCSKYIPNQFKSWQGKRVRDRIAKVLLSTTSSSKNDCHDKPHKHGSNNPPPDLTSLDSNASSLSAITSGTEMTECKSCPWSGIVTPSPSMSHHRSKPKIEPSHFSFAPNASSLSTSSSAPPSISNTSRRNIFLENLNLRLGDIDQQLHAQNSIHSSIPATITAEEILEDLESQLEVYRDLDTIKTQLLVEAKAELDSVVLAVGGGASVHSTVHGLQSPPEVGIHDYHHHQEGTRILPTPTSSMSLPELAMDKRLDKFHHGGYNYRLDPQQVYKAKLTKDTALSPCAIYPQNGETNPTALSTLSIESSEDPNYQASWQDMGNETTFATTDIHQVKDQHKISEIWNEIGNLISSNIQECVHQRDRWTLDGPTSKTTGVGTANNKHDGVDDRPASDNHDTKEDYRDTILHALARIYARIYLRPLPGMPSPQNTYPLEYPWPETGMSSSPATTRQDMGEDEKVEEAIHRISLRVQVGALQHMEERWQQQSKVEGATWPIRLQDHLIQHEETKQVDKIDYHQHNSIMDHWLGTMMASNEQWCSGPDPTHSRMDG